MPRHLWRKLRTTIYASSIASMSNGKTTPSAFLHKLPDITLIEKAIDKL
jgi:hypothetical protein